MVSSTRAPLRVDYRPRDSVTLFTQGVLLRPSSGDSAPTGSPRRRRGRVVTLVVLLLLALGVALAVLARPLLAAKHEADQAQAELKLAKAALSAKKIGVARADVAQARTHVDEAHADVHGLGAAVWSVVPVAGGAVDDARHLIDALDETTTVAQLGVQTYPMVSGGSARLVRGQRIDIGVLHEVVANTSEIGIHLDRALADLDEVKGHTPVVGDTVTRAKNTALGYLQPVKDSYDKAGPLVSSLPSIVGADGPKTYLLAMLNPAELRFSGGGALSFTTMRFDHGAASFGTSVNVDDIISNGAYQRWKPVPGNVFHHPGPQRVTSATFSPWWSVSGEELLRGYQKVYPGQHLDGVIGIDLQSLADVFRVTGPVVLPHFGTITADNLVHTLAGSYGDFASTAVRHQLNAELVPAFRRKFFEGGQMSDKLKALVDSAEGRHFFAYFRNPHVERRFARVGLSGDLSRTGNDYVGVFTQNLNGSKVDFWQHRAVSSRVLLHADGSATVHLGVTVANRAPAYALPQPDPRIGYGTRYLGTSLGIFLPNHARLGPVAVDGAPYDATIHVPKVAGVHNRRFFVRSMMLDSGQSSTVRATYTVPHAADLESAGAMTYRLDVDTQDLVVPERFAVSVTWPSGWTPSSPLPPGWQPLGTTGAQLKTSVTKGLSFEIPLVRR
jgi:hypothetical protein